MVWKLPMNEGGTNQPAPIVHNGVIYLANTGGIMQAIDGATGKVIWENHSRRQYRHARHLDLSGQAVPRQRQSREGARCRNGKVVWDTVIASGTATRAVRSSSTARCIEGLGGCQRVSGRKMLS